MWEHRGWNSGLGQGCLTPWSPCFFSEHWGIKQIFYNPLVLAASFCIPRGGTSQPVGNRSTLGVSQAGPLPREGEQLLLGEYLGDEAEGELWAAAASWYSMPAPTHPGAGCDKCAQHGGLGGDGWSSSFNLLEKRGSCRGLWVSCLARGPPRSLTVYQWERQREVCCGVPPGSPGPWLAVLSSW